LNGQGLLQGFLADRSSGLAAGMRARNMLGQAHP